MTRNQDLAPGNFTGLNVPFAQVLANSRKLFCLKSRCASINLYSH
jgi:hypothetical protein